MALNLPRIAAALNAYPWMAGRLTERTRSGATYCAMGALLRYAGVAQQHIACPDGTFWQRYGSLLRDEYGLEERLVPHVVAANDSASSQAEAIDRVLGVLTGAIDPMTLRAKDVGNGQSVGKPLPPGPDDGSGSLALVG